MNKIRMDLHLPILLTLLSWGCSFAETQPSCPIGYTKVYDMYNNGDPICYRLKGPEKFADQFQDCAGNLYTTKLYYNLNIPNPNEVLWTEYKTMYRGGPLIDWSYTDSMGDISSPLNVKYDPNMADEAVCILVDPFKNFIAARCDEEHYRYCFVKPFTSTKDDTVGCEDFVGSTRFYSPIPTCLAVVEWGNVTRNSRQAEKICNQRGGMLLNKGWIYARDPVFYYRNNSDLKFALPLGDIDHNPTWKRDRRDVVNPIHWLERTTKTRNRLGPSRTTLRDSTRYALMGKKGTFNHLFICERHVQLKQVTMKLAVTKGKTILTLNETVNSNDIKCFTDAVTYYPVNVEFTYDKNANNFELLTTDNGYYWCVLKDSRNYIVAESNKLLSYSNLFIIQYSTPTTNKTIESSNTQFECFDDSRTHNPVDVSVTTYNETANKFRLSPSNSSYYLCVVTDSKNYFYTVSHQILFIRDNDSLLNYDTLNIKVTALEPQALNDRANIFKHSPIMEAPSLFSSTSYKIHHYQSFGVYTYTGSRRQQYFKKLETVRKEPDWEYMETKLILPPLFNYFAVKMRFKTENSYNFFIKHYYLDLWLPLMDGFYYLPQRETRQLSPRRHRSRQRAVALPPSQDKLQPEFISSGEVHWDDQATASKQLKGFMESIHNNITVKKCVYGKEVLFHARLNSDAMPVPPVTWDDIQLVSIKPVHYCNLNGTKFPQGDQLMAPDGRNYTCLGDFNEGVQVQDTTTASVCSCTKTTNRFQRNDLLQQVLKDMKTLLRKDTVQVEDIEATFDKVDELLQMKDNLEIPGILLRQLDELASRVDLNGSTSAIAERSTIAMLVVNSNTSDPLRGLRIPVKIDDNSNNTPESIFGAGDIDATLLTAEVSKAVVGLPKSIARDSRRIKFIIFTNDNAFYNSKSAVNYSVNSRILSISIDNFSQFDIGETVDIYMKPMKHDHGNTRSCAYWHFLEDDSGYWSQEGCTFSKSTDGVLDVCRCTHLTHFAEILIPKSEFIQTHEKNLEVLTITGCSLSIFGIFMVGVTAAVFKSWRSEHTNKIWLQLCVAIFLLITCFMMIGFLKFDNNNSIICMAVGVALHYSVLASFCWMLVAAVLSYKRLVIVFSTDPSHKLLKASAFSWGTPCAVVGVLLAIDPHSYAGQFGEKAPSGAFCYPSGRSLLLAVYAPIAIMLLTNWTLFVLIVRSVFGSRRNIQRHGDTNEAVRCSFVSCLLVFLFGLPWIFGLFAYYVVAAYLFTLTATYQGFILFLFFVIGNKKTRELWLKKFKKMHWQVLKSSLTNKTSIGVIPKGRRYYAPDP